MIRLITVSFRALSAAAILSLWIIAASGGLG